MTATFTKLKTLLYVALGFFAALGVLSVAPSHPAQASTSPGVNLGNLLTQFYALQATVASQASIISALQAKTAPLSVSGSNFNITGVNVHIVDGTGSTNSTSGLGNLTIGYNAIGNLNGDFRTGSHNLILGDQNSYSSYGGLVAGSGNSIRGNFATVTGGYSNTASGLFASVSGGDFNSAHGIETSVSGGYSITQDTTEGWSAGSLGNMGYSGHFSSP